MTMLSGETSGIHGHFLHQLQQPAKASVTKAKQIANILNTADPKDEFTPSLAGKRIRN